ncbi:MAG: citrate synthase [Candidatus Abyssobacteria bacterium SURF_17]|jgi:citrate synthase|uniref:Citrate synthase n=1 Tax=Candidatus Abyssobacteria bacterium SURF_17 TaxID=2093361 RepID=A0A419ETX5_9BACT|nr:MAG: citrate synthase [Candidatus Abyssubacteria bacterium SURF_17]
MKVATKGLEDVIVADSEICYIDGEKGILSYRGYPIEQLGDNATFEEVIYLLWHGKLPNRAELDAFNKELASVRELPKPVLDLITSAPPEAHPMDVLRTAVSALAFYDPEVEVPSREANLRKAARLVAQTPTIIAAFNRSRNELPIVEPMKDKSLAENFLYMLAGQEMMPVLTRVLDVCLVLHADHDLNASTFAARVAVSTLADIYCGVTAAIGTLKGPLHGGANTRVMEMLIEIGELEKVEDYIHNLLDKKGRVMGVGHRVYKTMDPRARILKQYSKWMSEHGCGPLWYSMLTKIEEMMHNEKGLDPNVDFYSASVYYCMGVPLDLYTALFAMSRMAGWTAHILEQLSDNRLIRPITDYKGPLNKRFVPIDNR